jgi:hypothetical protein
MTPMAADENISLSETDVKLVVNKRRKGIKRVHVTINPPPGYLKSASPDLLLLRNGGRLLKQPCFQCPGKEFTIDICNTCSIDNILMAIIMMYRCNPGFVTALKSLPPSMSDIINGIKNISEARDQRELSVQRYLLLNSLHLEHIRINRPGYVRISLFDSERDMARNTLGSILASSRLLSCTHCNYRKKISHTVLDIPFDMTTRTVHDVVDFISAEYERPENRTCGL